MENEPDPDNKPKDPGMAMIWLMVGLAPIVILLSITTPDGSWPAWVNTSVLIIFCALLNLLGGFGSVRGVKDSGTRFALGLLVAFLLFALSWGVAIFQACSHMHF